MRKICGILSLMLLAAALWMIVFGAPWAKSAVAKATEAYLWQNGVAAEEVVKITGRYDWRPDGRFYYAEVYFARSDQPSYYYYDQSGKLTAFLGAMEQ